MQSTTPLSRAAGLLGAATLTFATLALAPAGTATAAPTEPCARQQTHVDKAHTALDRATARFADQQARVKKAKKDVVKADSRAERKAAKRELRAATSKRDKVKDTKRAQRMRVAKAEQRLETCLAAQEPVTTS